MDDRSICSLDSNPPPEIDTSDAIEQYVKHTRNLSRTEGFRNRNIDKKDKKIQSKQDVQVTDMFGKTRWRFSARMPRRSGSSLIKKSDGRAITSDSWELHNDGSDPVYVYPPDYIMSRRSISDSSDILSEVLPFPVGKSAFAECLICFEWTELNKRPCCSYAVCDDCIEAYCAIQVQQRMVKVRCLNPLCTSFLGRDEILMRLHGDNKQKFYCYLVDANKDPYIKTCPRCSHVYKISQQNASPSKFVLWNKGRGLRVECGECKLVWCFRCQAPWHGDIRCKDYQRGDKLVKQWAKQRHQGKVNAQKCPKCKCLIQRSTGCDHMTCNWCMTTFCYRCGDRYRDFRLFGNHYSMLSVFGCKYNFLPKHPISRKMIRASVFGGKILLAPVVGCVVLAFGAVFGTMALPFYCSYRLHQKMKHKKSRHQHNVRRWEVTNNDTEHGLKHYLDNLTVHQPRDDIGEVEASRIVESLDLAYWAAEPESLPSSSESDEERCHTSEVMVVSEVRPYSTAWESSDAISSKNTKPRLSHPYVRRFDAHCDVFVHSPREKAHKDSTVSSKNTSSVSSNEDSNKITTTADHTQLSDSECDCDNLSITHSYHSQSSRSDSVDRLSLKADINLTNAAQIHCESAKLTDDEYSVTSYDSDTMDDNTIDTTIDSVDTATVDSNLDTIIDGVDDSNIDTEVDSKDGVVDSKVDTTVDSIDNSKVETRLTASAGSLRDHKVVLHADIETTWL